jgi:glycine hydroxymethyltransferase
MGPAELEEIAAVVALVLKNVQPGTTRSGARDRSKYTLDDAIRTQAQSRVNDLLASYPVYPEIDLPFLLESFGLKSS